MLPHDMRLLAWLGCQMAFHELREKYRRLSSPEQAEAAWTSIFDHTRDHCTHFHGCKARPPLPAASLHACR